MDYAAWADYIQRHFEPADLPGTTVLDLACGTGSLTRELALRGYEMIGVDLSPEMLAQAAEKNRDAEGIAPIFLCQTMEQLDLYGTIDACVCCLDSVNYVTDPKKLRQGLSAGPPVPHARRAVSLRRQHPGEAGGPGRPGLSGRDRGRLLRLAGGVFPRRRICSYFMDMFRLDEETGLWERGEELHGSGPTPSEELTGYLREAGFPEIKQYGD